MSKEKMKSFVEVNIIGIVLLLLSRLTYSLFGIVGFIIMIIITIIYVIISNYKVLNIELDNHIIYELKRYREYPNMRDDIDTICRAYKRTEQIKQWINTCEDDRMQDIYRKARQNIEDVIEKAVNYCKLYDFDAVPLMSTEYLDKQSK